MTQRKYLGNKIDGIESYRIIVNSKIWGNPTTMIWVAAKTIAEDLMKRYPNDDIEIVGVVGKPAPMKTYRVVVQGKSSDWALPYEEAVYVADTIRGDHKGWIVDVVDVELPW